MKTIKCYAIDDDKDFLTILKSFVAKTPRLEWQGAATDPIKGLRHILNQGKDIQLLFLDVQMEPMSGLEIIPQLPKYVKVILCTSYREFACDAFELSVTDYLLKPVSFSRFLGAVAEAEAALNYEPSIFLHTQEYHFFFVRVHNKSRRVLIRFEEITHIVADGDDSAFHMVDGEVIVVGKRLGVICKRLPKASFLRIHHSWVISVRYIKEVAYGKVLLDLPSGQVLELGLGGALYTRDFYSWVAENMFE